MAAKTGSRYLGSTSTLTKAFSQIYFAISGGSATSALLHHSDDQETELWTSPVCLMLSYPR